MQVYFHSAEQIAVDTLITLALNEDLAQDGDRTSQTLIPNDAMATVKVVSRSAGVLAGEPIGPLVFSRLDSKVSWQTCLHDGDTLTAGSVVAVLQGPARSLFIGERTMLNFLTHLSGIATLTAKYVAAAKSAATVLDTRKTLPGWRVLQKYAVRCGGGTNHRMGLYDGVMIKDNHVACWSRNRPLGEAVLAARQSNPSHIPIQIEVDTLEQLQSVLVAQPDMVLLDNMTTTDLAAAVQIRNRLAPKVLLEASGGVNLHTIGAIAATGVDRISVGALTHSAPSLDLGLDWSH